MSRKSAGRRDLEQKIGHAFADASLLDGALTHISALSGKNRVGSYQRLEFLGDHVLGLVVFDLLLRIFPPAYNSKFSPPLPDIVLKKTSAYVARSIYLPQAINLATSEANAG